MGCCSNYRLWVTLLYLQVAKRRKLRSSSIPVVQTTSISEKKISVEQLSSFNDLLGNIDSIEVRLTPLYDHILEEDWFWKAGFILFWPDWIRYASPRFFHSFQVKSLVSWIRRFCSMFLPLTQILWCFKDWTFGSIILYMKVITVSLKFVMCPAKQRAEVAHLDSLVNLG